MQDWHQHEHQRINRSIEKLTRVVENGLSERTERIEKKVDSIAERLESIDKCLGHKVDVEKHRDDIQALWGHKERRADMVRDKRKEWAIRLAIGICTAFVAAVLGVVL